MLQQKIEEILLAFIYSIKIKSFAESAAQMRFTVYDNGEEQEYNCLTTYCVTHTQATLQ